MPRLVCLVSKNLIIEVILAVYSGQSSHSKHVVACLNWAVDSYKLALQSNVHDVHVDIHRVFAIGIHRLSRMASIMVRILSHKHVGLVLWTDQVLLLAIHLQLSLISVSRS